MKANMGSVDRLARLLIAALMVVLYSQGIISGTVGYILLGVSGIFVLTSMISFCPLYAPFGLSTCKVKKNEHAK